MKKLKLRFTLYWVSDRIRIFTDGGYSIPRNIGAWAFVVIEDNKNIFEYREQVKNSTSNRVELIAFLKALEVAQVFEEVEILSDSQYVVKGYNLWMKRWEKSGWKNKKDTDLWKEVLLLKNKNVKVKWIKGHSGNRWNEYVDRMTKV